VRPNLLQRVVVLKDEQNKAAHENASHLACEAAGAIRTVASLTREDDCCNVYSKSLEEPLRRSKRVAIYANMLFGFSQAAMFWVFALVFWYGAQGLADERYGTTAFFVTMFVSILVCQMSCGKLR
jgi:ATP-binding cassette subfamily B (MDR/TAP) protein 1